MASHMAAAAAAVSWAARVGSQAVGRSSRLRYSPVPAGEKKDLPILPRPPVWPWAMYTVPSGAPASARARRAVLVDRVSSATVMGRSLYSRFRYFRIPGADRRSPPRESR